MTGIRWCAAAGALLLTAAAADRGGLRGPVSGYVLDGRSRSLRPVNGMPGGAALGDPLQLGFRVDLAAVSAENDYAVVTVFRRAPVPLLVTGLSSGTPATASLDGAIEATALELSDGGNSVLLHSGPAGKLQLITGLPGHPKVFPAVDVTNWSGGIAAAAVDSAGTHILGAAGDGGIFLFTVQGESLGGPEWIGRVPGVAALSFLGTDSAVAGSATSGDVILFRGIGGALTVSRAAGAANGIASVRALRFAGQDEVCVVEGTSGKAAMIDVTAVAVHWFAAPGQANRCEKLSRSVMALNQPGSEPLLVLDASGPPEVFFVPVN